MGDGTTMVTEFDADDNIVHRNRIPRASRGMIDSEGGLQEEAEKP